MSDVRCRRYDTVIFDLDGTLLDTLGDLTNSTNYVMEQFGMQTYTQDQVRSFVGNGIRRLLERAVTREVSMEEFAQIHSCFREHYDAHCMDETEPYPGILSLLDRLDKEGFKLAIVSNKADFAVKKLNDIYFGGLVPVAIGECEGVSRKPAPDSVFRAMKELGAETERTVYVGDSEVDILTAGNAGLDCIAVSWGFRSREFLLEHGAVSERIAANVKELWQLLTADER